MTLADFPGPGKPKKAELDAVTWATLRSMGAKGIKDYTNIFNPAEHPPSVRRDGIAMDEAFGELTNWAWGGIESTLRGGVTPMTFMGFPALANLSQKAEYRRIVETLATEMTRKWIKITTSSEDNKTEKVKQLDAELRRLGVRDVFKKVAEHDGFFGRGHIYLDHGADPNDDTELATSIGSGSDDISKTKLARRPLRALRVIEPVWISPQDYSSSDPLSGDFYRPQSWFVQNRRIHASRLLTFVGRPVSDLLKPAYSFGGVPMTQLAMLYVQNWERIRDSVGRLVESFSVNGLKTKLAEAANAGDNGLNLQRRIDLFNQFRNNLGAFILDIDEEFFNVVTPLGGLDELQAQAQEHMAAVSGIPLVKLLGLSPHGLNASSEGEIRVFYDWVHAFQEWFFRPNLTVIVNMVMMGLWGEVDEEINVAFEPLWSSSELEAAQVQQTEANTDKTYIDAGVMTALEVRRKVANDKEMPYSGLDLGDAPDLSETERSENATRMATPILESYSQGLIRGSRALEELTEVGVFKTITPEDIADADSEPPAPDMDPQGQGGGPPSGQPSGGRAGGGAQPTALHLHLASAKDAKPFDLGRLTRIESEQLRRALEDDDRDTVMRILRERETHRPALDRAGGFEVYHGSPYEIEEFDASRIGSGEGNTTGWNWSYGEGLYFAQNPKVAEWYRDELSSRIGLAGKPLALNAATTHITGHVYKVHVDRPITQFIDWDKTFDTQPDPVRAPLVSVLGSEAIGAARSNGRTMGQLLKFMPPGTSQALADAGVAGVKYLDAGSRDEGTGTYNYVVFNPGDVSVEARDPPEIARDDNPHPEHDPKGRFTHKGQGVGKKAEAAPPPRHHVEFHGVDPRQRRPAQLSWESAPGKTTQHMTQFHDAPIEQRRDYQKAIEGVLNDAQGHDRIAQALGLRTGHTFSSAGVFQGRVNPGAQAQVDIGRVSDHDKQLINAGEAVRGMLLRQDAAAWHKPETPTGHKYLIPGLKTASGLVFPEDHGEALTHADAYRALSKDQQAEFMRSGKNNDANYVFKNDRGQILDRRKARQYAEKEGLLSPIGQGYKQPDLIAEHVDPKAATRFVDISPEEANMIEFDAGRPLSEDEATKIDGALGQVQGLEYAVVPTQKGWRVLNTGNMPNEQFNGLVHDAIEGVDSDTLPATINAERDHYVGDYISNDWSKSPNGEDYLQTIGQAGPEIQRSADTLLTTLGPKIDEVEQQYADKYGWKRENRTSPWSKGPAQDLLRRNGGGPDGERAVNEATTQLVAKYPGAADAVQKVRGALKTLVPTNAHVNEGGHTLDDGTWTPERSALHDNILRKMFDPETVKAATPPPGTQPTMTILGGRGGSGKGWFTGDSGPVDRKSNIVIDADQMKSKLPEYQGWNAAQLHEESSHLVDRAAEAAKKLGVNVAFDQTLRSGTSGVKRAAQFNGTHQLRGYYMHAIPEVAAGRAIGRFLKGTTGSKTGRYVPPEYILGSHDNEKNFDDLTHHLDSWELYDNNAEGEDGPKKVAEGKNKRHVEQAE